MTTDSASLIQRQLNAYNAKDVQGWLNTYAPDATQLELHGAKLAQGHAQLRERITARFAEPDLHARLLSRTVMDTETGAVVSDYEEVTRNFPEGRGTQELLCVYEVHNGLIQKASFAMGRKRL